MIATSLLFDANVWIALTFDQHIHNKAALALLNSTSAGAAALFCRFTQHSVLRLVAMPTIAKAYGLAPLTNAMAIDAVRQMMSL